MMVVVLISSSWFRFVEVTGGSLEESREALAIAEMDGMPMSVRTSCLM